MLYTLYSMLYLHTQKDIMLYERTLGQWLEHWAATTPDKEYIVYSDRNLRFTWSQFNRRVDDMAKGLIAIGVERGTHVGIWAANVPDWLTLLYACAKIGAVYVTVNRQSWNICARTRICTRSASSTAKKTATSCR